MYRHCINISRIVVSAELTCDDGLWRKVAGVVEEGSSVKVIDFQISRVYKPSSRRSSRIKSTKHNIVRELTYTLLSRLRNGKGLS
jgi:hypothetical protein